MLNYFIFWLARSYEPVHDLEQQYPSNDHNSNENNNNNGNGNNGDNDNLDDFNNGEDKHLSNTKTLKPRINYEIDYFHHSAFDLNYNSPRIILPPEWK